MRSHTITCPHCKKKIEALFYEHSDHATLDCFHCRASLSVLRRTELEVLLLGKPGLDG